MLLEILKERKTIFLKEPLVKRLFRGQEVVEVEKVLEEKKEEWRKWKAPEHLIDMAQTFAVEWSKALAEVYAPPELREAVFRYTLPKGIEAAEKWLKKMITLARGFL